MTKTKNGFTLIEMLITLAIMSILGIAILQMFNSTYRINTGINDNAEYQADAQIIMQKLQNELKYANSITINSIAPTGIVSGTKYLYVTGGIPEKNQGASLSDAVPLVSLRTGFTSVLTFKQSSSKTVEIIVDIFKNGIKVYTLDTNVNLNNMITNSVSGSLQGLSIEYTLPSSASLVQSIIVSSSSSTINTDKGTMQMIANILPLNAINGTITWSETNGTGTAIIDPNTGILSALTNGTVTVNATTVDGSVTSPGLVITISNQVIKVTQINITSTSTTVNTTLQMSYTVLPANATNQNVTWSVTNGTGTASIDPNTGILSALTNGTVTVIATANDGSGISVSKNITVSTVKVTGIVLSTANGSTIVKKNGYTLQMISTASPNNATNPSVKWSVTNGTKSATIDTSGLLKSTNTTGNVTVTATAIDGSGIKGSIIITISN